MRLKYRAAAGCIGLSLGKHIIFVIAAQSKPTPATLLLLHKTQTVKRARTTIDNITGYNNLIRLPLFQMGGDCLQGHKIAVNIGQNR
jgi:hypothetical protein